MRRFITAFVSNSSVNLCCRHLDSLVTSFAKSQNTSVFNLFTLRIFTAHVDFDNCEHRCDSAFGYLTWRVTRCLLLDTFNVECCFEQLVDLKNCRHCCHSECGQSRDNAGIEALRHHQQTVARSNASLLAHQTCRRAVDWPSFCVILERSSVSGLRFGLHFLSLQLQIKAIKGLRKFLHEPASAMLVPQESLWVDSSWKRLVKALTSLDRFAQGSASLCCAKNSKPLQRTRFCNWRSELFHTMTSPKIPRCPHSAEPGQEGPRLGKQRTPRSQALPSQPLLRSTSVLLLFERRPVNEETITLIVQPFHRANPRRTSCMLKLSDEWNQCVSVQYLV